MMDLVAQRKLAEVVARHGTGVATDAALCRGLLADHCPGAAHAGAVRVLVIAAQEGVGRDLLQASATTPPEVLYGRLVERLKTSVHMEVAAARWAVESWALALGRGAPRWPSAAATPAGPGAAPAVPPPPRRIAEPAAPPRRVEEARRREPGRRSRGVSWRGSSGC